jgi:chromosome partitioning protein
MIVECQRCGTAFSLDEAAIRITPCKARCSVCRYVFVLGNASLPASRMIGKKQQPDGRTAMPAARAAAGPSAREMPRASAPSNCSILVFSNQKGGVAKTTTCLNLGMALAHLKKRVLLVDFDVQANLTLALGYQDTASFYDTLASNGNGLSAAIKSTRYPGLSLLPANEKMVVLDKKLLKTKGFEYILRDKLQTIKHQYDFILIDTPPSIGFFTLNALTAANLAVIPCQCDFFATHGLERLIKLIELVKTKTNRQIGYHVLPTMYEPECTASNLILTKLKERYGDKTFKAVINSDAKVKEAQIMRVPLMSYSCNSVAGNQYMQLARELL